MGNYTIFYMFENPRRGRQARNLTTNVSKILDLKSSPEQMFLRKLSLGAPVSCSKRLEQVDQKCFTNYSIGDIFCSNKTVQLLPLYERWEGIVGYDFPL